MGQRVGLRSTILATAAASLLGCHPATIDDASETDTVITRRAEKYNYAHNHTYDIPDSIADLCNVDTSQLPNGGEAGARDRPGLPDAGSLECNDITHAFDDAILKEIRKNLEKLGYERVHTTEDVKPDVAMLVGALSSNNWVAYSYYPWSYYSYWWPYYPPGWGIYYPYYPVTSVVNYPTGTLVMDLVAVNHADEETQRTPSIWTGTISGLLAQGDVDSVTRVNQTIDQAFAQSAYLKVNP